MTIGDASYPLPDPFFVLATQNPIEQEGTYNLPEAEFDRFLMKLIVTYPEPEDELKIVKTGGNASKIPVNKILSAKDLNKIRGISEHIVCDDKIVEYIVKIVSVTRPSEKRQSEHDITRYITVGASPRAGIAILQCAKACAIMAGRSFVIPEDIKTVSHHVLRHRIGLSYEAAADGISSDDIIARILDYVPVP